MILVQRYYMVLVERLIKVSFCQKKSNLFIFHIIFKVIKEKINKKRKLNLCTDEDKEDEFGAYGDLALIINLNKY